ncbi:MAG: GNVR domain-containing protein [Candidatus Margulisiibacteriota bacterium]
MEDEISLKDMIDVLARQRKTVFWFFALCVAASIIISLITKPVYEAKTLLLIRTSGSGGGGQMSGLASMMGINLGGPYPAGGNIADLDELIKTPAVERQVYKLLGRDIKKTGIGKFKSKIDGNIMDIRVRHENPVLASAIADAYVEAVSEYWNRLNVTEARKKREYLEKQLPISEADLRSAENKLKNLTYLISSSRTIVGGQGVKTIEILRLEREFGIQETIYKMLRTEYANTKVQEAKEVSPFSDIEKSEVPTSPAIPNTKLNLVIGALMGLFGGVLFAFLIDYFQTAYKK